ncbi:MAG: hypothetical protein LBU74_03690 [Methanobacteriaceae archaeon]|jgi:hypothetical protein|nr:hypothetical protein [Candidatus Methanorudis spinitermitis]
MKNKFNKKLVIFLLTIGAFLVILSATLPLTVATTNLGNIKADCENTISINNDIPKFVEKPKKYAISPQFFKTKGLESKKNIIKTKIGNKKYTFKTEYFLPTSGKKIGKAGEYNEYWYNCQAITIVGKHMYILTSHGYNVKKGFIVRYDMEMLNKYKLNQGKALASLRKLGTSLKNNENLTKHQKLIKKAIKIGPVFNTGHGQSLAYNPKTKSLWMWQDDKYLSPKLKLMKINMKTLKPSSMYKFTVYYNNKKANKVRNLAFDKNGNFYFHQFISSSKGDNIFKGKIANNEIKIELLATIKNRPGYYAQALALNPVSNRLYLVFDGVFYSIPVDKLCNYTLTKNDFEYTILNTKREFEGMSFDKYGNTYLLLIRGTEVLKSI